MYLFSPPDYEPTLVNIHSASNYDIAVLWRKFVKNQKEHKMTRTEFQYMYMVMARAYNETDIGKKNPMPIDAVEQGSVEVWNDLTQEGFDPASNKTSHRDYVDLATFFSLYCNAHHAVRYHELLAVLEVCIVCFDFCRISFAS